MCAAMCTAVGLPSEGLLAEVAVKRAQVRVHPLVHAEIGHVRKGLVADLAGKGPVAKVYVLMGTKMNAVGRRRKEG
jgi:hypothetical protein